MLTVVVQGQMTPWTNEYVRKYKEFHCVKEVILSTWEGEAIPSTSALVVKSVRPENPGMGNRNMQIASSLAGCRVALTDWVLKVRTDTFLPQLNEMFDYAVQNQSDDKQIFCLNVFPGYVYHPQDWYFIGRQWQLVKLFDIPLDPTPRSGIEDEPYWVDKVRSETYLGLHYCERSELLKNPRKYLLDISPERDKLLAEWRQVIAARSHFVAMPPFAVECPKHFHSQGYPHDFMRQIYGCIYG